MDMLWHVFKSLVRFFSENLFTAVSHEKEVKLAMKRSAVSWLPGVSLQSSHHANEWIIVG